MNELKFWRNKMVKFLKWIGPFPNPWMGGLRLVAISFSISFLYAVISGESLSGTVALVYIGTALTLICGGIWAVYQDEPE